MGKDKNEETMSILSFNDHSLKIFEVDMGGDRTHATLGQNAIKT